MRKRRGPVGLLVDLGDAELVSAAADGDHDAFATLFRRHGPDVIRMVQNRCGSAALADDVAAMAFEKAWRTLDDIRNRNIPFRPWVFRLAVNELIDSQRAASRRARREDRVAGVHVATAVEHIEQSDDDEPVREAMASLSSAHQEVLTLRYVADLAPSEIAKALGISKGAVAVRTHRATAALRNALEGAGA